MLFYDIVLCSRGFWILERKGRKLEKCKGCDSGTLCGVSADSVLSGCTVAKKINTDFILKYQILEYCVVLVWVFVQSKINLACR